MKSASKRARPGSITPVAPSNRLLASLSSRDYAALEPHLRRVTVDVGHVVSEPLERARHVYFPETAVLSLIVVMRDGSGVEAATVGNEGVAGLSAVFGGGAMSTRCFAQIAGDAQRITSRALADALATRPGVGLLLRTYAQAFVNQLAQSVACNALHSIQQRCARWLLMTHDRVGAGEEFDLTQQFLSYMLGVRREAVSGASNALRKKGVIEYSRGHVRIVDRQALEKIACECYAANRADYARTLS